mmetsp:Transcript_38101/g.84887  ORF Transcript_38101/g.84887 Transcript_38101/m.84887 type:complete len:518 (+) Transcript_38101:344-1897(+)
MAKVHATSVNLLDSFSEPVDLTHSRGASRAQSPGASTGGAGAGDIYAAPEMPLELRTSLRSASKPPITFKADPRPRSIEGPPGSGPATVTFDQQAAGSSSSPSAGVFRGRLPPLSSGSANPSSDYQSHHHSLIPKHRGPSAYVKRHHASHGLPIPGVAVSSTSGGQGAGSGTGASTSARMAAIAALSGGHKGGQRAGWAESQWSSSSVGDLEALDSILDHLVVLDSKMRSALLRGPLISFETVVPEPSAAGGSGAGGAGADEDAKDYTFLTSVRGITGAAPEEGEEEEQEGAAAAAAEPPPAPPSPPQAQEMGAGLPGVSDQRGSFGSHSHANVPMLAPSQPEDELEALRATIPVPILPKLARMYITSKQTAAAKAPPPPPATAEYLLKTRPAAALAAPSYDQLCSQIRDVQRQYTCGTVRERPVSAGRPQRVRNVLDMYISGLDGPTLDEVVNMEDLPVGLERSRPSFVAMKKALNTSPIRRSARSMPRTRRNSNSVAPPLPPAAATTATGAPVEA